MVKHSQFYQKEKNGLKLKLTMIIMKVILKETNFLKNLNQQIKFVN